MAKIILGKPPKSFPKELSFPMLDGTVGHIKVTYKYRTRAAFSEYMDAQLDLIKSEGEAEIKARMDAAKDEAEKRKQAAAADGEDEAPKLDFGIRESESNAKKAARQVDFIMDNVDGWNLDVPFSRDAVEQLVDELPLAATTIIQLYREAMTEGRLGN